MASDAKAGALVVGMLCWAGILIGLAGTAEADRDRERRALAHYCGKVIIWRAGERAGIPEADRRGHADWQGIWDSRCKEKPALGGLDGLDGEKYQD